MKTIALLLWLFCPAGVADHGIYVTSFEVCAVLGPVIAEEIRMTGEVSMTWACSFVEAPWPDNFCWP